jgi:hypothetical protein
MSEYSPIPAILTAVFETAAAVWTFAGRGRKKIILPCGVILLLLAGYQVSETIACSMAGGAPAARIGFLDILWLPALGVFLVLKLSNLPEKTVIAAASMIFAAAAAMAVWILLEPNFVNVSVCRVVFAKYTAARPVYLAFGIYYQFGLASMLIGSAAVMAGLEDGVRRRHLADILMGTLCFVLPSLLIEISVPGTDGAMPSIMCHFALIFALFLARLVQREQRAMKAS